MVGPKHLGELKDSTKSFLAKILRFIIIAFLILLCIVIIKGIFKKDELVLQPIHVPKYFQESGFDGPFLAQKLHHEISVIYERARTVRDDETEFNIDQSKDIKMNVMGLGVSASNVIYHLRDLLGIQTNYVSGHLTDMEHTLALSLNVSDPGRSKTIQLKYDDGNRLAVFDSLIFEGAKFITEVHNPYRLAVFHNRNQDTDEALSIVRKLAQRKEDKKWAYNLWGNLVKEEKGLEKSIEYYQVALADDPNFELAHRNMGWTYFNMEKYEEAIPCFEKAIKLKSTNPIGSMNGLAMSHERIGEVDIARKIFKESIAKYPESIWTYRSYTEFLNRQKDTIELASVFDAARAQSFEGPMYYMMMGGYYFYQQKADSSLMFFEKAVDLEPNNIDALTAMFQISGEDIKTTKDDSLKQLKMRNAIQLGKRLMPLLADSDYDVGLQLSTLNRIAILEYETNQFDSAMQHINTAIEMAPEFGLLYSTKAEIYAMQGKMNRFYEILEFAFQNGFEFKKEYFDDQPYVNMKNDQRLLKLIEKYPSEKKKLKN